MRRGRPPTYCKEINGQMYVTPETLDLEVSRLEKHRTDCRNRYRTKRDMLRKLRPDLFDKVNGCSTNRNVIREFGVPIQQCISQGTETKGDTIQTEGCGGVREITLREAINFTGA